METIKWERPVPFTDIQLPQFPVDALPSRVRPYVEAVAESTQTPVDMAGSAALAVIASCMQGKYRVQAKADWIEPTNLYVLIVADPAERKSAIMNLMTRSLRLYETEYNERNAIDIKKSKAKKQAIEKKKRLIEDKYARGEAEINELNDIVEELSNFEEIEPLKLYVDDITPEKLISVMTDNDGIASVISAEGGIFDLLSGGMYSQRVNIDVYLKAHAGDSIRIDRIGRESENIQSPSLTLLLAVQTQVLSGLIQNNTFRGRGLTARFLFTMPTSHVGNRKYRTRPIPKETELQYSSLIWNLLDTGSNPSTDNPVIITLSDEADRLLEAFATELESKLKTEYLDFAEWAGKLCGAIVRISGILCRAERGEYYRGAEDFEQIVVDGDRMQDAIKLGRYFVEHARAAYSLMGADPVTRQCQYVLKAIRNAGLTELSKRDIMRQCRAIKKADELQPVIDRLCEYGYLSQLSTELRNGIGRPASPIYLVNPAVFSS